MSHILLTQWVTKAILTQLRFVHNWVIMGIQWLVHWWMVVPSEIPTQRRPGIEEQVCKETLWSSSRLSSDQLTSKISLLDNGTQQNWWNKQISWVARGIWLERKWQQQPHKSRQSTTQMKRHGAPLLQLPFFKLAVRTMSATGSQALNLKPSMAFYPSSESQVFSEIFNVKGDFLKF